MTSTTMSFISAGDNNSGQLCQVGKNLIPSLVTELNTTNLVGVSIGGSHCAAVYINGAVFGWGLNSGGMIGLPFEKNKIIKTPTQINGLPSIMKVKCGSNFTLFLSDDNNVFIASNNKNRKELIEKVETSGKCVSIFGHKYPWIVCEDGSLYRITNYDENEAKETTKFELPKTAKSKEIRTIISLYNVSTEICLTESGEIFVLDGLENNSNEFVEIESLEDQRIKKVSGIGNHIVALTEDGKVFVWGKNSFGQLGLGNQKHQLNDFVEIPKFSNFKIVDVSAGDCFSVFVDEKGIVWATGWGWKGKTLFGDEKDRLSPERVLSINKAIAVSCGFSFTLVQIEGIGGSPIFDSFPNAAQKNLMLFQIEKNEIEKKYQRLKKKNQLLEEEKIETYKRLETITKAKEEIEGKYESWEKEKREVDKMNDELRKLNQELEAKIMIMIKESKESVEVKDSAKSKEIEFLDEETLRNLKEVKTIGRGATSEVILVLKEEKYALKIITSKEINENQLKHFLGEYEILNSLNHQNIIKAFGISFNGEKELDRYSQINKKEGEKEKGNYLRPIMLLEYCPRNLTKEEIEKMGKLEKIKIIYEIVEGMICVHSHGIIHRDLKPENILIDSKGRVKICDFGISTLTSIETQTKGMGTMTFMAPELLNENSFSEKVDNYAFGVLMYFILTNGEYPKITIVQVGNGMKARIPDSINSVSRSLIERCWSFSPGERPSFIEIKEEIKNRGFELISLSKEEKKRIQAIIFCL